MRNLCVGFFFDFQRAFDTVDHEILRSKLDHYVIQGIANKWFETYLCNKKSMCMCQLTVLNLTYQH